MLLSIVNWLLYRSKPMDMAKYKMLYPKRKLDKSEQSKLKRDIRVRLTQGTTLRDPNDAYKVLQDTQAGFVKKWGPKPGPVVSRKEMMRRTKYRAT